MKDYNSFGMTSRRVRFLKKLKKELPYDPAISCLGIYPKKTKILIRKDICIPMFISALFTIAKIWKQPMCPLIDRQMDKGDILYTHTHTHTHTHNGILVIRNEVLPFAIKW